MRVVKTDNLTIRLDIQSIRGDRHLDNKRVFYRANPMPRGGLGREDFPAPPVAAPTLKLNELH
jgi:hypothetical protein